MDWEPAVATSAPSSPHEPALSIDTPHPHATAYIALDTNVLIHDFSLVKALYERLQRAKRGSILVPLQVIHELDGLKNNTKIADTATAATAWLLDQVRNRSSLRCESRDERVASILKYGDAESPRPDDAILSCCLYFKKSAMVTLWTGDRNLALLAEASGVPSTPGGLANLLTAVGVEEGVEGMELDSESARFHNDDLSIPTPVSAASPGLIWPLPTSPWRTTTPTSPTKAASRQSLFDTGSYAAALAAQGITPRATNRQSLTDTGAYAAALASQGITTKSTNRRSLNDTGPYAAALAAQDITTKATNSWRRSRHGPGQQRVPQFVDAKVLALLLPILEFLAQSDKTHLADTTPTSGRDAAHDLTCRLEKLYTPGYERPAARAAAAARTLELFLGPEPSAWGGARRIRSGEAGDAVVLLLKELGRLGVPVAGVDAGPLVAEIRNLP